MNTNSAAAHWARVVVTAALLLPACVLGSHAPGAHPNAPAPAILRPDELDDMVGPIALYPDELVAVVLAACTFPVQLVEAANFLERLPAEPGLQPGPDLHRAVIALIDYPEVVELLNRDLAWSRRLGEAVLAQRDDVLEAIASFRERAVAAGNLHSDEHQVVSRKDGRITIVTTEPGVIYVPAYEPRVVVRRVPQPVVHYYYPSYPRYYHPYPADFSLRLQFSRGPARGLGPGWGHHGRHGAPYRARGAHGGHDGSRRHRHR